MGVVLSRACEISCGRLLPVPWPAAPDLLWATSGAAEGLTELNAFDNALMAAGIANLNLMKVSSVIPAGARLSEQPLVIVPGTLVPTVYSVHSSTVPGETISSAVGLGFSRTGHGMIFEHHSGSAIAAERVVREMVEEGFSRRGLDLAEVVVRAAEHTVDRVGCTVAAVVLWWRELG